MVFRFLTHPFVVVGTLLVGIAVAAPATEAEDKLFELLDTSANGYLSGNEAAEVIQYDANGDKRVTKEELIAGRTAGGNDANIAPAPPAPSAPSAPPPPGPATPRAQDSSPRQPVQTQSIEPEDAVEALSAAKWYEAKVLKVQDGKYLVHYEGWSDTWDEWLPADRVRVPSTSNSSSGPSTVTNSASASHASGATAGSAVPANPISGQHGLNGLFLQVNTSYGMNGTLNFNQDHYYFSPDGRVFSGVPDQGLDDFDFEKACSKKPEACGYYGISGSQITFSWPGRQETMTFTRKGDDVELDGIFASRVATMNPGQKLDGTYSRGATSSYQGSFVGSARTITFHSDGTFESDSFGGVSLGSGSEGESASSSTSSRGRYRVGRNTLELKHSDGQVTKHTIYPYDMGDGRIDLSIDGGLMKK